MNFPRRFLKIFLSLVAAAFFLWLAFREVNVQELWKQITQVKLGWILPFALTMLVSHYLRAERWLLLLTGLEKKPTRSTLFTGVMLGYLMNYVFPRLGEVTRPVYVARQLNISSGRLLGTIVLERVIDLVSLIGFLMVVIFYFIGDHQAFGRIFGAGSWTTRVFLLVPAFLLLLTVLTWAGYRTLQSLKRGNRHPLMARFADYGTLFWKGFSSLRRVENWPLFVLLTVGIWFGYILMAYLPFLMLDLHTGYDLGLVEATVVTVISAVGISIPTPGGIGSYHLFVQQSLWLLFSVPLVSALTYATVTHGVTLIMTVIFAPLLLWFNKLHTLKKKIVR